VSVTRWPTACPECGSRDFVEIGRAEAGEFGLNEDVAIYACGDCCAEWDTTDVPVS